MRVLVTGGAGFIGANTCRALLDHPQIDHVISLDDLSFGELTNLEGVPVEMITGSILDRDLLDRLVRQVDAVIHLAARPSVARSLADPIATHTVNATGTLYVLEACRKTGAYLVAASSSSVYGSVIAMPKHEFLATRPMSPYGASKLAAESYLLAYLSAFNQRGLALRFFNVYGPMQSVGHAYAAVVPAFVDAALRGEPVPMYGDGKQSRDFTYVGSVTAVLVAAVVRRVATGSPVNLAFGNRVTLDDLVALLGEVLGRPVEVASFPARAGDVRHSQADHKLLDTLFPSLRPVPFNAGLAQTVDWYRHALTPAVLVD